MTFWGFYLVANEYCFLLALYFGGPEYFPILHSLSIQKGFLHKFYPGSGVEILKVLFKLKEIIIIFLIILIILKINNLNHLLN